MGYPSYAPIPPIGGLFPVDPNEVDESPCPMPGHDEVHASFYSSGSGSGDRFTVPLHLPKNVSLLYTDSWLSQVYVGLIVKGNTESIADASYAEAVFTANNTAGWKLSVAVWSSINTTKYLTKGCTGLNFTWNNSYWCEVNDVQVKSTLLSTIAYGETFNVTFVGDPAATTGLWLYANSTDGKYAASYRFNSTNTNTSTFEPRFSVSCPDTCQLPWAHTFGLGFGADLCPFIDYSIPTHCDSYNSTRQAANPPIEVGVPRYWNGTGYGAEYKFFAPESSSGACQGAPNVATCYNFLSEGGTGSYPIFSFNGSVLNFGSEWPWTTYDWGGPSAEFLSTGTQQDIVPIIIGPVTDSSRAGFVPPNTAFTVTAQVKAYGTLTGGLLHYRLNSSAFQTVALTRLNGTATRAYYDATVPGTGGNGNVGYFITATDAAGGIGGNLNRTVVRGPLPTFLVTVLVVPGTCGTVRLNGSAYTNDSNVSLLPGTYPISASGCYPYAFSSWSTSTGAVTVRNGELTVGASGTVTATFRFVRPLVHLQVLLQPATCGTVTVNGTAVSVNGTTLTLFWALNYSLSQSGCAGKSFSYWTVTGPVNILGSNLEMLGNGSVMATFVSSTMGVSVIFHTIPGGCSPNPNACGGVEMNGAGYVDNESVTLLPGLYSVRPAPPPHYGFSSWSTGGGVTVASGEMNVTSAGEITELNYKLTEVTILTYPAFCGSVVINNVSYRNGNLAAVTNHTTIYAYAVPCHSYFFTGWYTVAGGAIGVNGNFVTVNGNGILEAVFSNRAPNLYVAFITSPSFCGQVLFQGQLYSDSNFTKLPANTSGPISAVPCSGYGFVGWQTGGGITIRNGFAWFNASGSITAYFNPLVDVFIYTIPSSCGRVVINGAPYANNQTVELPIDHSYTIAVSSCSFYGFSDWSLSTGATVSNTTLNLTGPAIVQAIFTLIPYAVVVVLSGTACGTVSVGPVPTTQTTTYRLVRGTYGLAYNTCPGFLFLGFQATGNVSLSGSTLSVAGNGTLTATFEPVPPSLSLSVPASSLAGVPFVLSASIGVLLPPYTYNYSWTFGDGTSLTSPVNFTTHAYSTPGHYTVKLTVTDPYRRTAEANATVVVVPASASTTQIPATTWVALGLGAGGAALGAAVMLLSWRRRPPRDEESSSMMSKAAPYLGPPGALSPEEDQP